MCSIDKSIDKVSRYFWYRDISKYRQYRPSLIVTVRHYSLSIINHAMRSGGVEVENHRSFTRDITRLLCILFVMHVLYIKVDFIVIMCLDSAVQVTIWLSGIIIQFTRWQHIFTLPVGRVGCAFITLTAHVFVGVNCINISAA